MVWLYWTGFAMLLGAALNAELAKINREEKVPENKDLHQLRKSILRPKFGDAGTPGRVTRDALPRREDGLNFLQRVAVIPEAAEMRKDGDQISGSDTLRESTIASRSVGLFEPALF